MVKFQKTNPYDQDAETKYGEGYASEDVRVENQSGELAALADAEYGEASFMPNTDVPLSEKEPIGLTGEVTPMRKEDLQLPGTNPSSESGAANDPYARTRKATEEAFKSWRQQLLADHEKRQEANKKQVRNAQIVGIGKALGDMIAAIWGGVAASRNNATAIVPTPQSSKTSEQVQALISEGVVNAKDYENMMYNLAVQQRQSDIDLAKAYDELDLAEQRLAEQRQYADSVRKEEREYKESQDEERFNRRLVEIATKHKNAVDLLVKKGEKVLAPSSAKKTRVRTGTPASTSPKKGFSDGEKAIIGATVEEVIVKQDEYGRTTYVPNKPTNNQLMLRVEKEKAEMKKWGLEPNEENKKRWAVILRTAKQLSAELPTVPESKIKEALVNGYSATEIKAYLQQ